MATDQQKELASQVWEKSLQAYGVLQAKAIDLASQGSLYSRFYAEGIYKAPISVFGFGGLSHGRSPRGGHAGTASAARVRRNKRLANAPGKNSPVDAAVRSNPA